MSHEKPLENRLLKCQHEKVPSSLSETLSPLLLPKPSVTFLRPWKLTSLFILNVSLERIRHGGRQWKHACSFCFLSPTTPPAPSRHHFWKPCPVTRNQGASVWGILRPFSFVLSFYFLSSRKKWMGVSQSTLFPVQSVRNEAKKPGGLHTRPGLEGWGCIVGPLQTCMDVNRCIAKGFLRPCLICLSLTYTFTKARGVETTNWWQVF